MSRQSLGSFEKMAPKAVEYQKKVRRTWGSESSPEGEDASMALASQSECERKVYTDADVPGAWQDLPLAPLSVKN